MRWSASTKRLWSDSASLTTGPAPRVRSVVTARRTATGAIYAREARTVSTRLRSRPRCPCRSRAASPPFCCGSSRSVGAAADAVADVVDARPRSFAGPSTHRRAQWRPLLPELFARGLRGAAGRCVRPRARAGLGRLVAVERRAVGRSAAIRPTARSRPRSGTGSSFPIPPILALVRVILVVMAWPRLV